MPDQFNFHKLPSFADEATQIFAVSQSRNCPFYETGDEFELNGHRLFVENTRPTCLILANDFIRMVALQSGLGSSEAARQSHTSLTCSGCTGALELERIRQDRSSSILDEKKRANLEKVVESISKFSFFRHLDQTEIRRLLPHLKVCDVKENETVIRKGESGRHLFMVLQGSFEVLTGKEQVLLANLGKGEVFGEMSLLSGGPCNATIRAEQDGRLLALAGEAFRRQVDRHPKVQRYFYRLLTNRMHKTNQFKETLISKGLSGNLVDFQLPELLQALNMSQKTGQLTLKLRCGSARVLFNKGEINLVNYGQLDGQEAFYAVLKEQSGAFSFSPDYPDDAAQNGKIGEFMNLLMEGFVRIDEESREAATG
ncbi:MAG: cyclic nucleotide-binding domain-containing protein [Chitinivibrionales bacterium]|nr:cyclic nucleotide-binding domain-containing protein [Chitinivibrionales bacterium]